MILLNFYIPALVQRCITFDLNYRPARVMNCQETLGLQVSEGGPVSGKMENFGPRTQAWRAALLAVSRDICMDLLDRESTLQYLHF